MDALIEALEERARAEADEILLAARKESEMIVAEADREIDRRRAAAQAACGDRWKAEAARHVARARRRVGRRVLEARAKLLDQAFARTARSLSEGISPPGFAETLRNRLEEALACLGGRQAVVVSTPALATMMREILRDEAGVEVVEDGTVGTGFRLEASDGSLSVDGTLEGDLARRRAELSIEILDQLERAG
jgi:vacuolar-type H+-ATPase subunit E/Vma4